MYELKQSSAETITFFVHDSAGDAVTGLTDGSFTKRIKKASGVFGAMTVTITEDENGWYSIPLSTSHSDTLGLLTVTFTNAGAKQVNLQWRVEAKLIDDLNDAVTAPTALENADALLNRDMSAVSDTTARSPLNALRLLRNKWSVAGSTMTVTKEDDTTSAWTSTVSSDAAADPVIGSDPA